MFLEQLDNKELNRKLEHQDAIKRSRKTSDRAQKSFVVVRKSSNSILIILIIIATICTNLIQLLPPSETKTLLPRNVADRSLSTVGGETTNDGTSDNYRCSLTEYRRTVQIHGCVKFNITLNGCYGRCNSFAMANTEDLRSSLRLTDPKQQPPETDSRTNEISTNKGMIVRGGFVVDNENGDGDDDGDEYQIFGEPKLVHRNGVAGFGRSGSISNNMIQGNDNDKNNYRLSNNNDIKQLELVNELPPGLPYEKNLFRPVRDNSDASYFFGDETTSPNYNGKHHQPIKDIISIGSCCTMKGKPKFLTVKVLCTNGYRKIVFPQAQECHCSTCSDG